MRCASPPMAETLMFQSALVTVTPKFSSAILVPELLRSICPAYSIAFIAAILRAVPLEPALGLPWSSRLPVFTAVPPGSRANWRSEEHTSELQSRRDLVCRLLLEKKKQPATEADP